MWGDPDLRVIDLHNPWQYREVEGFLAHFGLSVDRTVEYTVALYQNDHIAGVGSFSGKILRNIAVLPEFQGEGFTAVIVSRLIQELSQRGVFHYFIFTRPDKTILFEGLGFREIARAEPHAALLEAGLFSIETYCRQIRDAAVRLPIGKRASLVVNCNPFTLGHRAVIKQAAQENDSVIVFVVSEDRSLFPFAARLQLVREGVADLANVLVVAAGDYSVSQATFPAYFTRGEEILQAQTRLDATVFGARIAPELGITARYVGEEPYCPVTATYNQALTEILPKHGVKVIVIPRVTADGEYISASKVRDMLKNDAWDQIAHVVPATTYSYLRSKAADPIIDKIKLSQSRH